METLTTAQLIEEIMKLKTRMAIAETQIGNLTTIIDTLMIGLQVAGSRQPFPPAQT